jgi:hypothetical protein
MTRRTFILRLLATCAVLFAAALVVYATDDTEHLRLAGVPAACQLTVSGNSASISAVDSGLVPSKRAATIAATISGQAIVGLVRIQQAPNGLFVDLVLSDTLANLDTDLGSMNLSTAVPAHPSPQRDGVDDEPYLSAGGT